MPLVVPVEKCSEVGASFLDGRKEAWKFWFCFGDREEGFDLWIVVWRPGPREHLSHPEALEKVLG